MHPVAATHQTAPLLDSCCPQAANWVPGPASTVPTHQGVGALAIERQVHNAAVGQLRAAAGLAGGPLPLMRLARGHY